MSEIEGQLKHLAGGTTVRKWVKAAVAEGTVIKGKKGKLHNFRVAAHPTSKKKVSSPTNTDSADLTHTLSNEERGKAKVGVVDDAQQLSPPGQQNPLRKIGGAA